MPETGPTYEGVPLLTRANVETPLHEKPAESTDENTFVGKEAAKSLTAKGSGNIAFGAEALEKATTAENNIAVGTKAGKAVVKGINNIVMGTEALLTNKEGKENVAIGSQALEKQTLSLCIAIGKEALKVATGENNIAIGAGAAFETGIGSKNVSIGTSTGPKEGASENILMGEAAGSLLKGDKNVLIGHFAGAALGKENTAIGAGAGLEKKGDANIFIGRLASAASATTSNKLVIANNESTPIIQGVMSATEASQEIGFLGKTPAKRPKVSGKRTAEFATVLETLCKGLAELGLITDETIP